MKSFQERHKWRTALVSFQIRMNSRSNFQNDLAQTPSWVLITASHCHDYLQQKDPTGLIAELTDSTCAIKCNYYLCGLRTQLHNSPVFTVFRVSCVWVIEIDWLLPWRFLSQQTEWFNYCLLACLWMSLRHGGTDPKNGWKDGKILAL